MRDTIGGRPYEIKKTGLKYVISFYPMSENAKNPDACPVQADSDKGRSEETFQHIGRTSRRD